MADRNLALVLSARNELSGALKKIDGDLGRVEHSGGKMGSALQAGGMLAATGVAALAGSMVALGGISLKLGMDFEHTMSGVKAVSGATAAEMKQLNDLALQLGKDTVFSAGESGKAIEELVKGGIKIEDIMGGAARATVNLAAAGSIDLASAAEIAANAMAMFNLKGADMARVSDQIAGAANASSLNVRDFQLSLSMVGAVANLAGQSFDSTAQAIAVMGKMGLKGSDAGTSLKQMLLNLDPTTNRAKKSFAELGIVTRDGANAFFDATGKAKSMRDIADILNKSTANLTDKQRLMHLEIMFGSDAIRAAGILAEAGGAGFDSMAEAMGKVTAESVAAERLNNVNGSLEQLKGSLETLAISASARFLPAIKGMVDGATEWVNNGAMPMIDQLGTMAEEWLPKASDAISGVVQSVRSFIAELEPNLSGAIANIQALWEKAWPFMKVIFEGVWEAIKGIVQMAWGIVQGIIKTGLAVLAGDWEGAWKHFQQIFVDFWEGYKVYFKGAMLALAGVFATVVTVFHDMGAGIVDGIKAGIGDKWEGLKSWFADRLRELDPYIKALQVGVQAARGDIGGAVGTMLQGEAKRGTTFKLQSVNPLGNVAPDGSIIGRMVKSNKPPWWVDAIIRSAAILKNQGVKIDPAYLGSGGVAGGMQAYGAQMAGDRRRQAARLQRSQTAKSNRSIDKELAGFFSEQTGGQARDFMPGTSQPDMYLMLDDIRQFLRGLVREGVGMNVDGVALGRATGRQQMLRGSVYGAMGGGAR